MKKLSDEEIDSLFQEAAANYEPAYHTSAWEAMNEKLESKPLRMPTWVIIAGIGALIFISGIGVGVWLNSQPDIPAKKMTVQETKSSAKLDKPASTEGIKDMEGKPSLTAPKPKIDSGVILSNHLPKEAKGSSSSSLGQLSNTLSSKSISKNTSATKNNAPSADQSQQVLLDSESESELLKTEAFVGTSASNLVATQLNDQQSIKPAQELNEIDSTFILPKEESKTDSLAKKDSIEPSNKSSSSSGKWFIKVMASPDNSSISFSSSSFAGYNISALLEYQLSNRWSLSTGVILSNKKYATDEELVYGSRKVNGLDGTCQVIDIPMMVHYRMPTSSRFSFYSGMGFSSYLMLSENYKYSAVSNSTYSTTIRTWETKVEGKNNEWFKLINISLGVNYQLNSRWSMLAEPFAKLPMAGVGEGKVLLSSTGIFLGLKYKIH